MKVYSYTASQFVATDLKTCWEFFSSPGNLKKITPASMGFIITSDPPPVMYAGQLITYIVKPLFGIPVSWVTEITQVEEGRYFIDEQRAGPYRMWHHEHFFRETEGGVEMTDKVLYALPFGFLGRMALPLVRSRIDAIFKFRKAKINEFFPGS